MTHDLPMDLRKKEKMHAAYVDLQTIHMYLHEFVNVLIIFFSE
jgi:hypothetical protein